jgi:hypothetical protein
VTVCLSHVVAGVERFSGRLERGAEVAFATIRGGASNVTARLNLPRTTVRGLCRQPVARKRTKLRVGCRAAREAGANVGRQAWARALARFDGRSVEDDQQQQ